MPRTPLDAPIQHLSAPVCVSDSLRLRVARVNNRALHLGDRSCPRPQIKMDYSPMAMSIVPTPAPITGVNYHLMLSTHTGSLMLYRGTRLVWGAKSDIVPICMATASVAGTDGMIVAADDKGKLEVTRALAARPVHTSWVGFVARCCTHFLSRAGCGGSSIIVPCFRPPAMTAKVSQSPPSA